MEFPATPVPRCWEKWADKRTSQRILGHKDLSTKMIDTHVATKSYLEVRSPVDSFPTRSSEPSSTDPEKGL